MQTTTLIFLFLTLVFSTGVAFFQYFFRQKYKRSVTIVCFFFKALSLFFLCVLLINPKIKTTETATVKPVLSVLVDNSLSTDYFKENKRVTDFVETLQQNKALNDKFEVRLFSFGTTLKSLDSLTFDEPQTNIAKAIQSVEELHKNRIATTLLLSDGNATIGNNYEFINSKQPVNAFVIGDTTRYADIRISQLNVNKYSYLNNKFPVEAFLYYEGDQSVKANFTITKNGRKVFSKQLFFSPEKNTQTVLTELNATKQGVHYYTAGVTRLPNEKNIRNNYKGFSVEVIDEQTRVLLLSSILHPDLGALKKAIESNKQRTVDIQRASTFTKNINDYSLVVFYQPDASFTKFFKQRQSNFMVISGVQTNWNVINQQQLGFSKKAIRQAENYQAVYNSNFITFLQKDIGWHTFPPLEDAFGDIEITATHQNLLFQKIVGVETKQPLVTTFEEGERKYAAVFGEGLWKWRASSYLNNQSFEPFDGFISNLVQYLASNKKRKRLQVNAKTLYPANSTMGITALYLDKNYQFDNRASLQITLTHQDTKQQKVVPFSLINNAYQVDIEDLPSGNYTYKVSVIGQNINSYGHFKIEDYQIEEQFTRADIAKLQKLTNKTGGRLYYPAMETKVLDDLLNNKNYYLTQKQTIKQESLVNWRWALLIIVSLLTIEWFVRKYHGKI